MASRLRHEFVRVIDAVIRDRRAKILSISYGLSDVERLGSQRWLSATDRDLAEKAFEKAVAAGINVFVASGDQGAYDCQAFDVTVQRLCAPWPDSPWIVDVGGTYLSIRPDGSYLDQAGLGGHSPGGARGADSTHSTHVLRGSRRRCRGS